MGPRSKKMKQLIFFTEDIAGIAPRDASIGDTIRKCGVHGTFTKQSLDPWGKVANPKREAVLRGDKL